MTLKIFGHGYIGGYSVKLATRPHEFELCRIHGGIREPILLYLFWFGGLCGKCIYIFIYIYIDGVYGCIWGSFEKETAFWGVATFSLWKIPFLECYLYTAGGAGPIPSVSFMGTWTTDSKPLKAGKKEKSEQEGLQGTMMADTWRASKHPGPEPFVWRSTVQNIHCRLSPHHEVVSVCNCCGGWDWVVKMFMFLAFNVTPTCASKATSCPIHKPFRPFGRGTAPGLGDLRSP